MINPSLPNATPPYVTVAPAADDEVSFAGYIDTLRDHRRLIASIAFAVTLIGIVYAYTAKPTYETNLLIHVEEGSQRESKNILGDIGAMFDSKTAAATEMELLRSRLVVSRAIDNLHLYISAGPKYFPWVGNWIARQNKGLTAPGLFGLGGYAWGSESINVPQFNVPEALQNLNFIITAEANGRYRLRQNEKNLDLKGQVGVPLETGTEFGPISLRIDQINARPGAQFNLVRSSRLSMIENIQTGLVVAELGKQSGVISAALQGDNPQFVSSVLNEIGREYMRQNAYRKTEEAQKSLSLLDVQLPDLKRQLEQSEAKLNSFRNQNGTIDLGEEAKLSLQQSSAAKLRKIDLEQRRTDLLNRFTSDHPAVIGINNQIRAINAELQSTAAHIRTLPVLEQDVLRLSRDVKVNTDLYTALLNTAQQLRLVTLGKGSNVRLVDTPVAPEKPISPNRPKVIAGALLMGLLLGVLTAFARKAVRGRIDDPSDIEKILGVPVFVTIPHSKMQADLFDEVGSNSKRLPLLARSAPTDVAIESLRNFRAALQFSLARSKSNIVLIAGPTSGMGKTFVSVNLAALLAASGKRVLLIDADFRNGHLHRYFELGRQSGLSDYLSGAARLEQVLKHHVIENLDFISTGSLPPSPAELLLRPALGNLLKTVSGQYDVVLIDATPILPVADTLIIGAHVGSIFLMSRAGVSTPGEIAESIKRLAHAGLAPKGVLFNDLSLRPGRYGYGYKYGHYRQAVYVSGDRPLIEATPA
jgi:tyrosine-protein kinase Etk/Wzc